MANSMASDKGISIAPHNGPDGKSSAVAELRGFLGGNIPSALDDTLLLLFLENRRFHVPSAAERAAKLAEACRDLRIDSFDAPDDEILKGLKTGIWFWGRTAEEREKFVDHAGRPFLYLFMEIDWSKLSATVFCKTAVWCMVGLAKAYPKSQTEGVNVLGLMDKTTFSMVNIKAQKYVMSVMQGAVPFKVHRIYIAHQPWFVSAVVWPILRPVFQRKMRERVFFLGNKGFEESVLRHIKGGIPCAPEAVGGKFKQNGTDVAEFFERVALEKKK